MFTQGGEMCGKTDTCCGAGAGKEMADVSVFLVLKVVC